ncbi:MAG: hypothetical protein ACTSXC_02535 [Candidatus Freyarchaeota archaeon]
MRRHRSSAGFVKVIHAAGLTVKRGGFQHPPAELNLRGRLHVLTCQVSETLALPRVYLHILLHFSRVTPSTRVPPLAANTSLW